MLAPGVTLPRRRLWKSAGPKFPLTSVSPLDHTLQLPQFTHLC